MIKKRKSTAVPYSKKFSLVLIGVLLLLSSVSFAWWVQATSPVDSADKSTYIFVIPPGQETVEIIQRLKIEGLIRSPLAFKVLLLKEGLWGKVQAGDFRLSPSMTAKELAHNLTEGRLDVWVVLPEGLRAEEVTQIAGQALKKVEEFQKATSEFLKEEGYLFPDTYLIPREAGPKEVMTILKENFNRKTLSWQQEVANSDLTQEKALILASLVEREAKFDEDRVKVAEILIKRLRNDWPLQVDAAIQYAKASDEPQATSHEPIDWWPKVKKEDLEIDSPYNTYLYKGLPPVPICNPGLESLEAVLETEKTPYWYYVSDKAGKMHYAETLEEHEENVRKYLQD